jgi:DNA-binding CsgD family transcriptional regulator
VRVHCIAMGAGTTVLLQSERPLELQVSLSPREQEALSLVAAGLTARRIARQLGVAESTVRTHLNNAKEKLNARTLPEAVSLLGRAGLSFGGEARSAQGSQEHGD